MAEEVRAPIKEAEIPWVVAYLREDIQDVRGEIREVRRSIQRLDTRVDELRKEMDGRFDELRKEMDGQLRWIIGIVLSAMVILTGVFGWFVSAVLR